MLRPLTDDRLDENKEAYQVYDEVVEAVVSDLAIEINTLLVLDIYDAEHLVDDPGNEYCFQFAVNPEYDDDEMDEQMDRWSEVMEHGLKALQERLQNYLDEYTELNNGDFIWIFEPIFHLNNTVVITVTACK